MEDKDVDVDVDVDVNQLYEDIKSSMKNIITQTNTVLKHSSGMFKKVKEKMIVLENIEMTPSEKLKPWCDKKKISKITIPEFYKLLFEESSKENRLNYKNRTIVFYEEDAKYFGFPANIPINILDLFEKLPDLFEKHEDL